MTHKRIIIILTVLLFLLIVIIFFISINRTQTNSNNNGDSDITAPSENTIPTGIIADPNTLADNELDILSVTPRDQTANAELDAKIEITFSRPFTENEIIFSMGPDLLYKQAIHDNTLTITPLQELPRGTLFTYSIDFPSDKQKIRVYTFTTTGKQTEFLPDTSDQKLFEQQDREEREKYTDIYVVNRLPYETTTFRVESEYVSQVPAHFKFTVIAKIPDKTKAQEDFKLWLYTLELSDEQIDTLDITYQ